MINMKYLLRLLVILSFLFSQGEVTYVGAQQSIVANTAAATYITNTSAVLGGSFNNPAGYTTIAWFQYGTTTSYGSNTTAQGYATSGNVNLSTTVTGLNSLTTYHYRIVTQNSGGMFYGSDQTFATYQTPTILASGYYPDHIVVDSTSVYWSGTNGIFKISINGGPTTTLVSGIGTTSSWPSSIAIDATSVYFADFGTNTIKKVGLNGGLVTTLASGASYPVSIAVNATSVYWGELCGTSGTVKKVGINGGTVTVLASGLHTYFSCTSGSVALDSTSVYWAEYDAIKKVGVNGGIVTVLALTSGVRDANSVIAVDSANVYWPNGGSVMTVGVNGGTRTTLGGSVGSTNYIDNIIVDATSVYVTTLSADRSDCSTIRKMSKIGGAMTALASDPEGSMSSFAVDSTSVYWAGSSGDLFRLTTTSQQSCTYTLTPTNYGYSAASNAGTISVASSSSSCTWTATSNASWITVTSGSSGAGSGTVTYNIAENTTSNIRTGIMTIANQTFTVTQAAWTYSNSIGSRNSIKVTDMSGTRPTIGGTISVKAWDAGGNAIPEPTSAAPLTLNNNGTTTIPGDVLIARFPTGTPMLYALSADSSKYIITNVKISSDGTLNVPNGATSGTTKFVANSVGGRNSIKITDMSGSLSTPASIIVAAWDVNGTAIPEATGATPLTLNNHGTTTIAGTDLMARFPAGTPMSYEFTVGSSQYVITNVKSSSDGSINIPYAYTSGMTNFVANSIGARNTIKISDVSGSLSTSGAAITISAWDVNGNAIPESTSAAALKLYSRETTSITGTNLAARFPSGIPMSYEFAVNSSKYIITNIKSSIDGTINIPAVYTSGTTTYASNYISSRSTIKITDASGSLSSSGAVITVAAWDANGNALTESGSATPLTLYNNGTTTITGTNLATRLPTGTPSLYEFTIGSSKYLVTNVTSNTDGTVTIPSVYSSGVAGGI